MSRRPHAVRPGAAHRWVPLLVLLTVWGVAACGGDDSSLATYGAPGAHEITQTLVVDDARITVLDAEPAAADVMIPAHTDLTLVVRNAGAEPHQLTLYASEQARDVLARTDLIAPGAEVTLRYHFHDPQTALLRDDAHPGAIAVRIVVTVHEMGSSG